tara:strand:- start:252 stop:788 length:537 start_codon:yes stop_codon:yes gene_type:complete
MNTHREQKNGRVVQMPVYISDHITDEMIRLFLKSGEALTVNAGIMSEQVVLPYLEDHFASKGIVANADGYDHLFENGIRNEHKKLAIRKTSATAKNIGANKEGKCDTISFHHAIANAIYVIQSETFFANAILNYDKTGNCYDVSFYSDMQLEGKGKRLRCNAWKNTEMLIKHADKVAL